MTSGHVYSTITVLGAGGWLQLPELGIGLEVKPGDIVCFLANQQLHRLTIDQSTPDPDPTQTVLTLWTDAKTLGLAIPSAHTHPDFQPACLLSEDVRKRYYLVEDRF
jgi:hypothetical protein